MAVMHCPHCGAENFTMEGWEDLDHCSSCGKPLGEPISGPLEGGDRASRAATGRASHNGSKDRNARKPRRT